MDMVTVMDFVVEHKFWLAVATPIVIAVIVMKILG